MLKFLDLLCSAAQLCMTPLTVAHQTLLYKEFPRREYWSKLPFPTPGDLPDPGIKPMTPASPALAAGFASTDLPVHTTVIHLPVHRTHILPRSCITC